MTISNFAQALATFVPNRRIFVENIHFIDLVDTVSYGATKTSVLNIGYNTIITVSNILSPMH